MANFIESLIRLSSETVLCGLSEILGDNARSRIVMVLLEKDMNISELRKALSEKGVNLSYASTHGHVKKLVEHEVIIEENVPEHNATLLKLNKKRVRQLINDGTKYLRAFKKLWKGTSEQFAKKKQERRIQWRKSYEKKNNRRTNN